MLAMQPATSFANVTAVNSSPGRVSIPAKGPVNFRMTWSVTDVGGIAGPSNVTSAAALLQVNGTTIATLAGSLSQTVTLGLGEVRVLTFNENYMISPALAQRLSREAPGTVTIRRIFTDGGGTVNAVVPVSTSNAGDLAVRRIDLKFENETRTDVIQKGDTLRAIADISFRSNGLLRGEWRLVAPTASMGGALTGRRVLQVVRQQLVSSGEGRTRIVSPPLPTNGNGLYLVSFSVEDTDSTISVPILRYFVLEGRDNVPPVNVDVLTPGDHALIDGNTVFSWNTLKGAQAYQVEILKTGAEMPVTSKLVPGTDLKLSLSSLNFEDLMSGQSYDWRVRAFAGGKLIGQSKRYSFKVQ